MATSGPFKHCASCNNKVPLSDNHSQCLFCLSEERQPASCSVCKAFTKPALKQRLQRLRSYLWEKSLCPTRPSAMEPPCAPLSDTSSATICSPMAGRKLTKSASSGSRLIALVSALKPPLTLMLKKKKKSSSRPPTAPSLSAPISHVRYNTDLSLYCWEMIKLLPQGQSWYYRRT